MHSVQWRLVKEIEESRRFDPLLANWQLPLCVSMCVCVYYSWMGETGPVKPYCRAWMFWMFKVSITGDYVYVPFSYINEVSFLEFCSAWTCRLGKFWCSQGFEWHAIASLRWSLAGVSSFKRARCQIEEIRRQQHVLAFTMICFWKSAPRQCHLEMKRKTLSC